MLTFFMGCPVTGTVVSGIWHRHLVIWQVGLMYLLINIFIVACPTNTSTMSHGGMYMIIMLMVFDWENFCSFKDIYKNSLSVR